MIKSVHRKITLMIAAIFAAILTFTYFYLQASLSQFTYQQIQSNLAKNLKIITTYLGQSYRGGYDVGGLDGFADRMGKDIRARVTVIDQDGTVLGDSDLTREEIDAVDNHLYRPEIQQAIKTGWGESRRFSNTIEQDLLYIAAPFELGANKGFLRLAIPLSDIEAVSKNIREILIIAFAFALMLSVLSGYAASKYVSGPIIRISSVAQSIAQGDFTKRAHVRTHDEIQDLAESINYMADQIKARMKEVTSSRSRMEAVLLSMFEGVMVVDAQGKIILMNQAFKQFLQIERDVVGLKPLEVIRNIEIQEIVNKVLGQRAGVESREISVLFPQERSLLIHGAPVFREGNVEGAVMVFHDITELRRLENVRKDFVANVSHELRTPITSIKGYAETLLDGAINDKKNAQDFLQIITSEAERLAKLVDDILDLSKLESGKTSLNMKPVRVQSIFVRVLQGLATQFKQKGVELVNEIPSELPNVHGDEASIAQVALNLVENAVKYNKPGGTVRISAQAKIGFVEIAISDTGIGIPKEHLPRIFERFYRVDKARSRRMGGTGLGLSIVKHIIQAHREEIWVESRPDEGSTFRFTLPTV